MWVFIRGDFERYPKQKVILGSQDLPMTYRKSSQLNSEHLASEHKGQNITVAFLSNSEISCALKATTVKLSEGYSAGMENSD